MSGGGLRSAVPLLEGTVSAGRAGCDQVLANSRWMEDLLITLRAQILCSCHARHTENTLDSLEMPVPSTSREEYPLFVWSFSMMLIKSPHHTPGGKEPQGV